jgi:hypothetical protein
LIMIGFRSIKYSTGCIENIRGSILISLSILVTDRLLNLLCPLYELYFFTILNLWPMLLVLKRRWTGFLLQFESLNLLII